MPRRPRPRPRPTIENWSWNPSSDPTAALESALAADSAMQTEPSTTALQNQFPMTIPFRPRPTNMSTNLRTATPAVNLTEYLAQASAPTTPTVNPANAPTTPTRTTTATHRYPTRSRGPPSPVDHQGRARSKRARRAKFNAEMNDFVAKVLEERRMEKLMKGVGDLGVGAPEGEPSTDATTLRMRDTNEELAWAESAKMTFRIQWGGVRRRPDGQPVQGQSRRARRRRAAEERARREAEGEGNGSLVGNDGGDGRPQLQREEATVGSLATGGHDFVAVQLGGGRSNRSVMDLD